METFNLQKEQVFTLTKSIVSLEANLYWKNKSVNVPVDLDLSAFCLDGNGKVVHPSLNNVLFYNTKLTSKSGELELHDKALVHSGDDLGDGVMIHKDEDGNDMDLSFEQITVNTKGIPDSVKEILFVGTVALDSLSEGLSLNNISNAGISIFSNNKELMKFDFDNNSEKDICVFAGSLLNKNGVFTFVARGDMSKDEFGDVINNYCTNVRVE